MELTGTFESTRAMYRGRVGLLPTMGFFHEGHLALMDLLRTHCDTLVVSLFVNPTQFDDRDDFAAYPRAIDRDAELARDHEVDLLFVPEVEEVYPVGETTIVDVGGV
jgi:pantoate--beta-alanine ligase